MQGLIGFPISPWNVFTRINEDFLFCGCLFIWSIISVIAEAKDQHEDWL